MLAHWEIAEPRVGALRFSACTRSTGQILGRPSRMKRETCSGPAMMLRDVIKRTTLTSWIHLDSQKEWQTVEPRWPLQRDKFMTVRHASSIWDERFNREQQDFSITLTVNEGCHSYRDTDSAEYRFLCDGTLLIRQVLISGT